MRVAVLSGDPGLMGSMARELEREKAWSRIHLVPLLLAEGDRGQVGVSGGAPTRLDRD